MNRPQSNCEDCGFPLVYLVLECPRCSGDVEPKTIVIKSEHSVAFGVRHYYPDGTEYDTQGGDAT